MCAGLVAKELGAELYQVDVSKLVSKWIGETEKNLAGLVQEIQLLAAGYRLCGFYVERHKDEAVVGLTEALHRGDIVAIERHRRVLGHILYMMKTLEAEAQRLEGRLDD